MPLYDTAELTSRLLLRATDDPEHIPAFTGIGSCLLSIANYWLEQQDANGGDEDEDDDDDDDGDDGEEKEQTKEKKSAKEALVEGGIACRIFLGNPQTNG
ncbi:hypothetical protein BC938DRAFT_481261 [Jimgerdemannia flammicorona]|uniref:Uncharacterized protein n=1 Tax=Jimgerdemannia flammicorona TaxID=994334 RepID=A0A433QGM1_9FUNG|nr:hypothetical protein BC938DRAFT_481261 [Jimgerdemannia flammicorona]